MDAVGSGRGALVRSDTTNLADLLERILDKGIVIAGDIAINLVDIELLTIRLRLLIASADKAKEMDIDWWESDGWLSSRGRTAPDRELSERIERLEAAISAHAPGDGAAAPAQERRRG